MKAILLQWKDKPANLPSWFDHTKEMDISWDQIQELYECGVNLMIKHDRLGGDHTAVIYVDWKGFSRF